jgi:peptidoglycan hydrolase CwlO-like protein
MKKYLFLIPFLGLMFSCSEDKKQTEMTPAELQEQIEVIEKSTQNLDESIHSSEHEMEKQQNEIDSLLNNI